jgi:hypothetical protein
MMFGENRRRERHAFLTRLNEIVFTCVLCTIQHFECRERLCKSPCNTLCSNLHHMQFCRVNKLLQCKRELKR